METALKYTVLEGDTFYKLATGIDKCAGVTWEDILKNNPGVEPKNLKPGQVINIPGKNGEKIILKYTILSGDTFYAIAEKLANCKDLTLQELVEANYRINPYDLQIGELINIPVTNSYEIQEEKFDIQEEIKAYYCRTWAMSKEHQPDNTNMSVAFSGWPNPSKAIEQSKRIYNFMKGTKFISLGGGSASGSWNTTNLSETCNSIRNNNFSAYQGIVFDVEVGDENLEDAFKEAFSAAKDQGLIVIVSVSHSAPYSIPDAVALMNSFFQDENIDYLVPMLYGSVGSSVNDYTQSTGVTWNDWSNAKAKFLAGIWEDCSYQDAQNYFKQFGITFNGYMSWTTVN